MFTTRDSVIIEWLMQSRRKMQYIILARLYHEEELLKDFSVAPRHVGNIFDSVDDRYFYWSKLVNDVLDNHAPQKKLTSGRGTWNT